jgi:hypothetical protein
MNKVKSIVRTDLYSKTQFAQEYELSRAKLDELIHQGLLSTEQIANVQYINISDEEAIKEALSYKNRTPFDWARSDYAPKRLKKKKSKSSETFDDRLDKSWKEFEGITD